MPRHSLPLVVLSGLLLAAVPAARAQVPSVMPLQGRIDDNAGVPVASGAFAVTFKLYRAPSGGTAVWTERWPPDGHTAPPTLPAACRSWTASSRSISGPTSR